MFAVYGKRLFNVAVVAGLEQARTPAYIKAASSFFTYDPSPSWAGTRTGYRIRLSFAYNGCMETASNSSILRLAAEEASNVGKSLQLLGDTYDLVTMLERLYDTLPSLCRIPVDVATNDGAFAAGINANLVQICRRELTVGVLCLLRGYRVDFLFHIRKAIEFCAFAAKMARHPELSRVWFSAASSDDDWENFRKKFVKLYPQDDKELTQLYMFYDKASEAMHSSPKAVAHFLLSSVKGDDGTYTVRPFDIRSDAVLVAYFISAVDNHITILSVFYRILNPYLADTAAWEKLLHDAKVILKAKHAQWMPLVHTGITPSAKE